MYLICKDINTCSQRINTIDTEGDENNDNRKNHILHSEQANIIFYISRFYNDIILLRRCVFFRSNNYQKILHNIIYQTIGN